MDMPLILSEAIDWYKKRKKKMMLFKVDFEKAFDSVSWRYLDFMLCNLGFGLTWRSWIKACLESSRTSILINDSPTSEFNVRRGSRQGDPLSPFLFIIIMGGLHVALSYSVRNGLIRGINISNSDINLSHLFFAGDVVITMDWSNQNLDNIIRIFIGSFPFTYLGLPIGSNIFDDDDVLGVLSLDSSYSDNEVIMKRRYSLDKAYDVEAQMMEALDYAYNIRIRCRTQINAEPPSVIKYIVNVLLKCLSTSLGCGMMVKYVIQVFCMKRECLASYVKYVYTGFNDDVLDVLSLDSRYSLDKAYGVEARIMEALDYAYNIRIRCRAQINVESPSVIKYIVNVLLKCLSPSLGRGMMVKLRYYSNPDSLWVKVIGALEKMALIIMVANIMVYGLRLFGLLITGIQAPSFPWIPFAFRFDTQTSLIFPSFSRTASFKDLNALVVLVYMDIAAAGYNMIQLIIRGVLSSNLKPDIEGSYKHLAWLTLLFDQSRQQQTSDNRRFRQTTGDSDRHRQNIQTTDSDIAADQTSEALPTNQSRTRTRMQNHDVTRCKTKRNPTKPKHVADVEMQHITTQDIVGLVKIIASPSQTPN
ncbi:RNA-directed DNA polymerase, eukaryota, reverse transcriptase zinc-binding domain protein [Tanacetum coccineum]|uniref:RNA-directed DNA polymerase, eukaryota, reverse transcriptase zinc-binding domain protein n=1 Tax=Tanacetum coccineum TaxID=301880 RepID=A0ABQ5BL07_9ASTR